MGCLTVYLVLTWIGSLWSWKYCKTIHFDSVLTWQHRETIHFDSVLNLEILETRHFDPVLNLELLGSQSFWFSFEPGNTGKPVILIQCSTWKYWKAPCCLGHVRKNPFWEYVSWRNWIWYISLNPYFLICFSKKDARQTMMKFGGGFAPRSLIWDRCRPEN